MDLWLDLHRRHHFVLNLADNGRVPNEAIMELLSKRWAESIAVNGLFDYGAWGVGKSIRAAPNSGDGSGDWQAFVWPAVL